MSPTVVMRGFGDPGLAKGIDRRQAPEMLTIEQIGYPVSALVYALVGTRPVRPVSIYTQDWVAGLRIVLRIPRRSWVPPDARSTD